MTWWVTRYKYLRLPGGRLDSRKSRPRRFTKRSNRIRELFCSLSSYPCVALFCAPMSQPRDPCLGLVRSPRSPSVAFCLSPPAHQVLSSTTSSQSLLCTVVLRKRSGSCGADWRARFAWDSTHKPRPPHVYWHNRVTSTPCELRDPPRPSIDTGLMCSFCADWDIMDRVQCTRRFLTPP